MKQYAEDVSVDMGQGGEITDEVIEECARRLQKLKSKNLGEMGHEAQISHQRRIDELERTPAVVMTHFASDSHFDSDRAGTTITSRTPQMFEEEVNKFYHAHSCGRHLRLVPGYADFCKLAFVSNWTDAKTGTMPITPKNFPCLRSEYKSRKEGELSVLVRWLELPADQIPQAEHLCLVLYDREHLAEEGINIGDADWGIVAILGQMHDREEPMTPMTAMRNALGIEEGGSGVPLDHEAYMRSVDFWDAHATVKAVS